MLTKTNISNGTKPFNQINNFEYKFKIDEKDTYIYVFLLTLNKKIMTKDEESNLVHEDKAHHFDNKDVVWEHNDTF